MPRSTVTPRWRAVVMQATLWALLLIVVGLAMLVTQQKRRAMRVELSPPSTFNMLEVQLPKGWTVRSGSDGGDFFFATEPAVGQESGRELRVFRQRSGGLIAPLEHLIRKGFLTTKDISSPTGRVKTESIEIGGWPGTLVSRTRQTGNGDTAREMLACATLPGSEALVIQLEVDNPNAPNRADVELVRQIAESTGLKGQAAPPDAGGSVTLADGIALMVPPHFILLPQGDDPNQRARQLLLDGGSSRWTAVDLVPVLFFNDDNAATFETMLAARDPSWRGDAPQALTGRRGWRSSRVDSAGGSFPSRAYLLAGDGDEGLLAVFRGGFGNDGDFDATWESIAASVQFTGRRESAQLLQAGGDEARRLSNVGLDELLGAAGSREWIAWDAAENAGPRPWLQADWRKLQEADTFAWTGVRSMSPLDPYGSGSRLRQEWRCSGDLSRYRMTALAGSDSGSGLMQRPALRQQLTADGGRLFMDSPPGAIPTGSVAPAQFVPGAIVPLVLGSLTAKTPMILRTESFIDCEGAAPPGLLTLLVLSDDDAPVKRNDKSEPLRCVSVMVNGTGRVTRWYFEADNTLRSITFANGLTVQPVENRLPAGNDAK